jgi:putative ubiquitin-RnfH superfamily antitoxin RatB of RatAB toxin-antitoxin module
MANAELAVEVVYALPEQQVVVALNVPAGSSLYEAARLSGLAERFGFELEAAGLGVFGKLEKAPRERVVRAGERVEIYRPLLIDPKAARQARADKARAARAGKKPN